MVQKNEPIKGTEYTRWIQRTTIADGAIFDSFGRIRVSTPYTLFDSKNLYKDPDLGSDVENLPLFFDNQEVSGSGTSTSYNENQSSQSVSVSENTAGKRVRQTYRRLNYQPGKSQLHFNTFVLGAIKEGITKREGYFDEQNGLFLEVSDDVYFVNRSYTSGVAVDTKIKQSDWNLDRLNGLSSSKIKLDLTKTQILTIDFEWLGVGRVRFGFVIDGKIYYCHEFNNANTLDVVYSTTPNLPIRTEIENDGTGEADTVTQICSTVISEGGQEDTGIIRCHSNEETGVSLGVSGTLYLMLGIRIKENYIGETIKILDNSILSDSNGQYEWQILFRPTLSATPTWTPLQHSAIETSVGDGTITITDGIVISGGYGSGRSASNNMLQNALSLGSSITGISDELVLAVRPLTNNQIVRANLNWRELS